MLNKRTFASSMLRVERVQMETRVANLNNVLAFIREAPLEDFRWIRDAVRAVERRRLREIRKCFKPGDEVEWTIRRRTGLDEHFKGRVVKVNSATCSISVETSRGPWYPQRWRVPFGFFRHVEKVAKP